MVTQVEPTENLSFEKLMHLGQVSFTQGDDKIAHEYWQRAAMLEPDNEQVWIALMYVITDQKDRKVCLNNILAINPNNDQAKALYQQILELDQAELTEETPYTPRPRWLRWIIGFVLEFGFVLLVISIGLAIGQIMGAI